VWRRRCVRKMSGRVVVALAISAAMLAGCGGGRLAHTQPVATRGGATIVARGSLPTGETVIVEVARAGSHGVSAMDITSVVQTPGARLRGPADSITSPLGGDQPAALALLPRCRGSRELAVVTFGAVRGLHDSVTAVEKNGHTVRLKTPRLSPTTGVTGVAVFGVLHTAPREILVRVGGRLVERERYNGVYARLCASWAVAQTAASSAALDGTMSSGDRPGDRRIGPPVLGSSGDV
jgi:hypothetical protein